MPKMLHHEKRLEPAKIKGLTLTRPMVLMDVEEYEGMKETLEILFENPNLIKKLRKAEEEFKKGKTVSWEKLKRELKI